MTRRNFGIPQPSRDDFDTRARSPLAVWLIGISTVLAFVAYGYATYWVAFK